MSAPACALVLQSCGTSLSIWVPRRCARATSAPSATTSRAGLSAACLRLCVVLPRASEALVPAEAIFTEYAYFSSYSTAGCGAGAHAEMVMARFGSMTTAWSSRWQQRRLSPTALRRPRCPRARRRSGGQRRCGGAGAQRADAGPSSARRRRETDRAGRGADLIAANNVLAQVRICTISRRRGAAAQATRRRDRRPHRMRLPEGSLSISGHRAARAGDHRPPATPARPR